MIVFFFYKQKTAYEMRISDWSSDVCSSDLLPEPEETGSSFEENAVLKARAACEATGLPAIADDSGLEVPALDGQPGIYTARWAGPQRDFFIAMRRVHEELGASPDRRAFFCCTLSVAWPAGATASLDRKGTRL